MNCPMCDSAYTGQAGMEMAGLVSWQCMDCRFLWWMTPVPIGVPALATESHGETPILLSEAHTDNLPTAVLEAA